MLYTPEQLQTSAYWLYDDLFIVAGVVRSNSARPSATKMLYETQLFRETFVIFFLSSLSLLCTSGKYEQLNGTDFEIVSVYINRLYQENIEM